MKCPYCGEENPVGEEICGSCGERIYIQHEKNNELIEKAIKADNEFKFKKAEKSRERSGKIIGCITPIVLNVLIPIGLFASSLYSCNRCSIYGVGIGESIGTGFLLLIVLVVYIWARFTFFN